MLPGTQGSFRLFRLFGIEVRLHWLWILAVVYFVSSSTQYRNRGWAVAESLSLFGIVLMHEFGHALACRSVGGQAERIILWPLGGVAFVNPPMRPGAFLWSIAAGPLVNVALAPVTIGAAFGYIAIAGGDTDAARFILSLATINGVLLVFNILPIYPLDGGQILQSILWFFVGFARSLRWTAALGLVVAVIGGVIMLYQRDAWLVMMAFFVGWQAWNGYRLAGEILRAQAERARALAQAQAAVEPWDVPPAGPG
jgi:Zn-dependent protease